MILMFFNLGYSVAWSRVKTLSIYDGLAIKPDPLSNFGGWNKKPR